MLTVVDGRGAAHPLERVLGGPDLWIDLLRASPDELATVERATGANLPSADDREAIEQSSRLFRDEDALYLTATVLAGLDRGEPRRTAIAFILHPHHLITVRDDEPAAIDHFRHRLAAKHRPLDAASLFVALVDALSDRLADELQLVAGDVQRVSDRLFRSADAMTATDGKALQATVVTIGRLQDRLTKARESAAGLERLLSFFAGFEHLCADVALRDEAESVRADCHGLVEDAAYQAGTVQFLLDTTLGLIGVDQNNVMEVVSVVSVVFIPPTLFASIWGMNFARMPELAEPWGYPVGLAVIALSAVVPYLFFRWKRWL